MKAIWVTSEMHAGVDFENASIIWLKYRLKLARNFMKEIILKRIYDAPSADDGYRVLVDRLWPRGVSKEDAKLDEWNKEITPSTALRKWFNHERNRFEEFAILYKLELKEKEDVLDELRKIGNNQTVCLLYAARDPEINHAIVLKKVLEK
jgi:uncharacterized protein YeaO (DUF488 family)